jgi:threonine synthase
MDIQVASNFERYLYYLVGQDAARLSSMMSGFAELGELAVELNADGQVDDLFAAGRGDTENTLAVIKRYHAEHGYVLDPHTAVGVFVAEELASSDAPTICLATAHPAKFTQAIVDAIGEEVHHPTLDALADAPTRCDSIENDVDAVKQYLVKHI